MSTLRRPLIPKEFYYPSTIGSIFLLVYAFALFVVPGLVARSILLTSLPLPLDIILMIPLIWLAGQGALLIGWIGHEGAAHFALHRNKLVSLLVGIFAASALPSYLELGFAISHINHHRFTNQASDPDCPIFGKFQNIWSRLFLARLYADRIYIKNIFLMAFNRPLPYSYSFPYKGRALVALTWINIGFSLLWIAFYTAVFIYDPLTGLVAIALPMLTAHLIYSLQPYLEHTGTEVGIGRDARSRTAFLFTILYCGNNYHLEHHLYPGVPCYRLPSVHRLLQAQGFYDRAGSFIEPSIFGVYAQSTFLSYPEPGKEDSEDNPMIPVSAA